MTPEGLNRRLRTVGPRFRGLAVSALDAGRADEAFIDATCDPPQTFTYGRMLAHVLTFSAVRRTMVGSDRLLPARADLDGCLRQRRMNHRPRRGHSTASQPAID